MTRATAVTRNDEINPGTREEDRQTEDEIAWKTHKCEKFDGHTA
jgi:hypothetical protein